MLFSCPSLPLLRNCVWFSHLLKEKRACMSMNVPVFPNWSRYKRHVKTLREKSFPEGNCSFSWPPFTQLTPTSTKFELPFGRTAFDSVPPLWSCIKRVRAIDIVWFPPPLLKRLQCMPIKVKNRFQKYFLWKGAESSWGTFGTQFRVHADQNAVDNTHCLTWLHKCLDNNFWSSPRSSVNYSYIFF